MEGAVASADGSERADEEDGGASDNEVGSGDDDDDDEEIVEFVSSEEVEEAFADVAATCDLLLSVNRNVDLVTIARNLVEGISNFIAYVPLITDGTGAAAPFNTEELESTSNRIREQLRQVVHYAKALALAYEQTGDDTAEIRQLQDTIGAAGVQLMQRCRELHEALGNTGMLRSERGIVEAGNIIVPPNYEEIRRRRTVRRTASSSGQDGRGAHILSAAALLEAYSSEDVDDPSSSEQARAAQAEATVRHLETELSHLMLENQELRMQLHDALEPPEAWKAEHAGRADGSQSTLEEVRSPVKIAGDRIASLHAAGHTGQAVEAAAQEALAAKAALEEQTRILAAEREEHQRQVDDLRAQLARQPSPTKSAGADQVVAKLQQDLDRARAKAADDQAELVQLRSTNKGLQQKVADLQSIAAKTMDLQRQMRRGSSVAEEQVNWEQQQSEMTAQLELVMLANRRLELDNAAAVAAATPSPAAEAPSPTAATAAAAAAAKRDEDTAKMRRYFADVNPARSLGNMATFLEDRRDAVRKQVVLMNGASSAREPLAKLLDLYEEHLAALAPYKQAVQGFEKLFAQNLASVQQTEQKLASAYIAVDEFRQQAAQLREDLDRLRKEYTDLSAAHEIAKRERSEYRVQLLTALRQLPSSSSRLRALDEPDPVRHFRRTWAAKRIQRMYRRFSQAKRAKRNAARSHIVHEILETEESYVRHLAVLSDVYMSNFRRRTGVSSSSVLTRDQYEAMFGQVYPVVVFNQSLLDKIRRRVNEWSDDAKIGDVFLDASTEMRIYTHYVNNYSRALAVLHECRSRESFRSVLAEIKEHLGRRSLELSDLLIMPVQRIPRYVLLLQTMLSKTSRLHPDHPGLTAAVESLKRTAEVINRKKGESERFQAFVELQVKLVGLAPKFEPLVKPGQERALAYHGDLQEQTATGLTKERRCFLFNDLFLCTKVVLNKRWAGTDTSVASYEYKWGHAMASCLEVKYKGNAVVGSGVKDNNGNAITLFPIVLAFQAERSRQKRILYAATETDRTAWGHELERTRLALLDPESVYENVSPTSPSVRISMGRRVSSSALAALAAGTPPTPTGPAASGGPLGATASTSGSATSVSDAAVPTATPAAAPAAAPTAATASAAAPPVSAATKPSASAPAPTAAAPAATAPAPILSAPPPMTLKSQKSLLPNFSRRVQKVPAITTTPLPADLDAVRDRIAVLNKEIHLNNQLLDATEKLMINSTVKARAKVAAEADDLTKRLDKLQRELKTEQQKLADMESAVAAAAGVPEPSTPLS